MRKKLYKSNGVKKATPADPLDMKDIKLLKAYFKKTNIRDWCLFTFNLNVGLRASDLLNLPQDLLIVNGEPVESFEIIESKTGKRRVIELNKGAQYALKLYYKKYAHKLKNTPYLFPSKTGKPLTLSSYDRILREAGKAVELPKTVTLSSHTARKTLGTTLFEKKVPIEVIQNLFMHSDPRTTLIYIDIYRKHAKAAYSKVNF